MVFSNLFKSLVDKWTNAAVDLEDVANNKPETIALLVNKMDNYVQKQELPIGLGKSLHAASIGLFVVDKQFRVVVFNPYMMNSTGYSKEQIKGKVVLGQGIVNAASRVAMETAMQHCCQGLPVKGSVIEFVKSDGSDMNMMCSFAPLITSNGLDGMMVIAQDISAIMGISNAAFAETPCETSDLHDDDSDDGTFAGWEEVKKNYTVETVLGQGSYGQVAKAKNKTTGEIVAIKKIQNVFSDPVDAKRILRELCIVRQLDHPNLVQIREIACPTDFQNFKDIYVVFEYLPTDLEKLLHSPQFLTAEHLRWLLLDLLKALKYMHSAQIVHRDLKPANVLLNLSPVSIKICDFGLARGMDSSSTEKNNKKRAMSAALLEDGKSLNPRTPNKKIQRQLTEHVVTRWYRAPEIIFRAQDYCSDIDVWSVGCIFAELLSMQKSSSSSHYQREPLFPGVSCFPLSPGYNSPALPQDSRDQLNVILDVLGTPSEEDINDIGDPDVRAYLRGLEHRPPKSLQEIYPGAEPEAIDLLQWLLKMNPNKRASVDEALRHKYLDSIRNLEEEIVSHTPISITFDTMDLNVHQVRKLMQTEIRYYHPEEGTTEKKRRN